MQTFACFGAIVWARNLGHVTSELLLPTRRWRTFQGVLIQCDETLLSGSTGARHRRSITPLPRCNVSEGTIAPAPAFNVAALQAESQFGMDLFGGVAGNRGSFLPRLQLFTASSNEVKEGKIGVAVYGVVKGEDIIEVGKNVPVVPLAWRAKAMNLKADPPQAYHNQKSPEFQDFMKRAADPNSGYVFGPEFLLWMGEPHGFVTMFFMSKTARNSSPDLRALLPGADGRLRTAVLSAQLIENDDYKWHGPKIMPSSQTIAPPPDDLLEMTTRTFLTPKDYDPNEVKNKKEEVAAGAQETVAR